MLHISVLAKLEFPRSFPKKEHVAKGSELSRRIGPFVIYSESISYDPTPFSCLFPMTPPPFPLFTPWLTTSLLCCRLFLSLLSNLVLKSLLTPHYEQSSRLPTSKHPARPLPSWNYISTVTAGRRWNYPVLKNTEWGVRCEGARSRSRNIHKNTGEGICL